MSGAREKEFRNTYQDGGRGTYITGMRTLLTPTNRHERAKDTELNNVPMGLRLVFSEKSKN